MIRNKVFQIKKLKFWMEFRRVPLKESPSFKNILKYIRTALSFEFGYKVVKDENSVTSSLSASFL